MELPKFSVEQLYGSNFINHRKWTAQRGFNTMTEAMLYRKMPSEMEKKFRTNFPNDALKLFNVYKVQLAST